MKINDHELSPEESVQAHKALVDRYDDLEDQISGCMTRISLGIDSHEQDQLNRAYAWELKRQQMALQTVIALWNNAI